MKLVEVYKKLALIDFDTDDLSRELIKEGKVIKIAAENWKTQERHLYLVSKFCLYSKTRERMTIMLIPPQSFVVYPKA